VLSPPFLGGLDAFAFGHLVHLLAIVSGGADSHRARLEPGITVPAISDTAGTLDLATIILKSSAVVELLGSVALLPAEVSVSTCEATTASVDRLLLDRCKCLKIFCAASAPTELVVPVGAASQ
jgi:hypothetical protein